MMRRRFIVLLLSFLSTVGLISLLVHTVGGATHLRAFLVAAVSNFILVLFSIVVRLPPGSVEADASSTGVSLRPLVKLFGVFLACLLANHALDIETKTLIPWMLACYFIALVLETVVLVRWVTREEGPA